MSRVYCMVPRALVGRPGETSSEQRVYASRASAEQYAAKRALVIVDSWRVSDPPPHNGTAEAWDLWRTRNGRSGVRS